MRPSTRPPEPAPGPAPATGDAAAVGPAVRAARLSSGQTLAELSSRVNVARTYLCDVERGRKRPSIDLLAAIERATGRPAGALVEPARWQAAPASVKAEVARARRAERSARELAVLLRAAGGRERGLDELHRSGLLRAWIDRIDPPARATGATPGSPAIVPLIAEIPLINRVAAGYPREFTDLGYPARIADEYVRSPDVADPDAFAARVVGDSMEPAYAEGDIVIFSPARPVASGADCFVRLERDAETTFKRVHFEPDGRIRLQPLNPRHAPRTVGREDVAGLYAAVSVIKPVG